jgi:transcriptional regulator with XRE-family HTH domain
MEYGQRLAELRAEKHLTQEELALKVGITRSALSHYENNRREPDYETIQKFADFFHVTVDYLMGRSDDPSQASNQQATEFINQLELSDQAVLDKFALMIDGRELTSEEAMRFIHFIRAQRSSS